MGEGEGRMGEGDIREGGLGVELMMEWGIFQHVSDQFDRIGDHISSVSCSNTTAEQFVGRLVRLNSCWCKYWTYSSILREGTRAPWKWHTCNCLEKDTPF